MVAAISIADFKNLIGKELGVSDWLLIEQTRIDGFAKVTEDYQYIHVDPERAAKTEFDGTIAHGLLILSLLGKFIETLQPIKGTVMSLNYGFNKIRFLRAVKCGQSVRARFDLLNVEERNANQYLATVKVTFEIQYEDTPACVAESIGLTVVVD